MYTKNVLVYTRKHVHCVNLCAVHNWSVVIRRQTNHSASVSTPRSVLLTAIILSISYSLLFIYSINNTRKKTLPLMFFCEIFFCRYKSHFKRPIPKVALDGMGVEKFLMLETVFAALSSSYMLQLCFVLTNLYLTCLLINRHRRSYSLSTK